METSQTLIHHKTLKNLFLAKLGLFCLKIIKQEFCQIIYPFFSLYAVIISLKKSQRYNGLICAKLKTHFEPLVKTPAQDFSKEDQLIKITASL